DFAMAVLQDYPEPFARFVEDNVDGFNVILREERRAHCRLRHAVDSRREGDAFSRLDHQVQADPRRDKYSVGRQELVELRADAGGKSLDLRKTDWSAPRLS